MNSNRHFDLLAPLYEKVIHPPTVDDWQRRLRLPAGGKILDAGGGTGRIASRLVQYGDAVLIVDESAAMLAEAKRKGLQTTNGATENLPFSDHAIDRILMVDAFHHLSDQTRSVAELWRVLKPGGRLVIEEPDIRTFGVKLIAWGEKLLLMRSHFWAPDRIAGLFSQKEAAVQIEAMDQTAWVIVDKNE